MLVPAISSEELRVHCTGTVTWLLCEEVVEKGLSKAESRLPGMERRSRESNDVLAGKLSACTRVCMGDTVAEGGAVAARCVVVSRMDSSEGGWGLVRATRQAERISSKA